MPEPLATLPDKLLLQHRHRLLLNHLPGLDPSINRAAGTRIAEMVGEVAVELCETRLENKRVREKEERKGAAEYFGANLTHLLNLVKVTNAKDLPPVWEYLARDSKHQQLLVLQRAFSGTAEEMDLRDPTIATPYLLKLVLALGFRMESRDDLTTGIYPFVLGQHTATAPSAPVAYDAGRGAERMLPEPPTNPDPSVRTQELTTPSPHTPPKKRTQPRRMTSEPSAKRPIAFLGPSRLNSLTPLVSTSRATPKSLRDLDGRSLCVATGT